MIGLCETMKNGWKGQNWKVGRVGTRPTPTLGVFPVGAIMMLFVSVSHQYQFEASNPENP